METVGYLLVLKPEVVLARYEQRDIIRQHHVEYRAFRHAFAAFSPTQYRGIGRKPFDCSPVMTAAGDLIHENSEAKAAMRSLLHEKFHPQGSDENESVDYDLLATRDDAKHVRSLLDRPTDYEIIGVRRQDFTQKPTILGFDIGYWGGDHFSLIADTIVIPTWHGPPEEAYVEVAEHLTHLNNALLFPAPEQAMEFKQYYTAQSWAETEDYPGEFCLIQVEEIPGA